MVKEKVKLPIWKPRKEGGGAAAFIEYNDVKQCMFLSMIPQQGKMEKPGQGNFDKNKESMLTAKLGLNDLGEILLVLNGRRDGVGAKDGDKFKGLYHKNDSGNSIIGFEVNQFGYGLSLSCSKNGGAAKRYSLSLTPGEGEQLRVLIEHMAMPNMLIYRYDSAASPPAEVAEEIPL